MSSNLIKLSDDDMAKINDVQQAFATLTIQSGKIRLAQYEAQEEIKRLNGMEVDLYSEYDKTLLREVEIGKELKEKYGNGYVDLTTGMFIKDEVTEGGDVTPVTIQSQPKPTQQLQERTFNSTINR